MDRHGDGNGWIFGLCFICFGIVAILSMGVFSLMYHGGMIGKYFIIIILFPSVCRNKIFGHHIFVFKMPHQIPKDRLLF